MWRRLVGGIESWRNRELEESKVGGIGALSDSRIVNRSRW